jgi:hypothetical protein
MQHKISIIRIAQNQPQPKIIDLKLQKKVTRIYVVVIGIFVATKTQMDHRFSYKWYFCYNTTNEKRC